MLSRLTLDEICVYDKTFNYAKENIFKKQVQKCHTYINLKTKTCICLQNGNDDRIRIGIKGDYTWRNHFLFLYV